MRFYALHHVFLFDKEFYMYKNIGKKLMAFAKILGWIFIIAGVLGCAGVIAFHFVFGYPTLLNSVLFAVAALAAGFFLFAGTWVFYGWGKLVNDVAEIREKAGTAPQFSADDLQQLMRTPYMSPSRYRGMQDEQNRTAPAAEMPTQEEVMQAAAAKNEEAAAEKNAEPENTETVMPDVQVNDTPENAAEESTATEISGEIAEGRGNAETAKPAEEVFEIETEEPAEETAEAEEAVNIAEAEPAKDAAGDAAADIAAVFAGVDAAQEETAEPEEEASLEETAKLPDVSGEAENGEEQEKD